MKGGDLKKTKKITLTQVSTSLAWLSGCVPLFVTINQREKNRNPYRIQMKPYGKSYTFSHFIE